MALVVATRAKLDPNLRSLSRIRYFGVSPYAHEMRNELVEELVVNPEEKILQSRTGSPSEMAKPSGWRAKQAEERKK
jgi:hypothetical protein